MQHVLRGAFSIAAEACALACNAESDIPSVPYLAVKSRLHRATLRINNSTEQTEKFMFGTLPVRVMEGQGQRRAGWWTGGHQERRALDPMPRPPRPLGGGAGSELLLAPAAPELRLGRVLLRDTVCGAGSANGSNFSFALTASS